MKLAKLRCDCGKRDLLAIAPGHAGATSSHFRLTPDRRDVAWCEKCWRKRYVCEEAKKEDQTRPDR